MLQDPELFWNGRELHVNPQRDPVTEKRIGTARKARAFLKTKCPEGSKITCTYEPDWILKLGNEQAIVPVGVVTA